MFFWELGYKSGWFGTELLRQAVKTEKNPYGEITTDEYFEICGEEYGPQ